MTSKYQPIWDTLKKTDRAEVQVSTDSVERVIHSLIFLKKTENKVRKELGLVPFSKMGIQRIKHKDTPHLTTLVFTFSFSPYI